VGREVSKSNSQTISENNSKDEEPIIRRTYCGNLYSIFCNRTIEDQSILIDRFFHKKKKEKKTRKIMTNNSRMTANPKSSADMSK